MHHIYTHNLLNQNQFEFTPKKSTTDAAMAAKEFIEEKLRQRLVTILVSLESKKLSMPLGGRAY
jgi:hypothetical protein